MDVEQQYEIFKSNLKIFESTLLSYGYQLEKIWHDTNPVSYETFYHNYVNSALDLDLSLSFSVGRGDLVETILGLSMHGPKREFFSLDDYQETRKPEQIKTRFARDENLAENIQKFFEDLQIAFDTYLNDQITGKSFENHKDQLVNSYHAAAYGMQKEVVEEAKEKIQFKPQYPFLTKLYLFFMWLRGE